MSDQPSQPVEPTAFAGSTTVAPAATPALQRLRAWAKHFKTAIVAVAGVGAVVSGLVGYYGAYKTVAGTSESGDSVSAVANADALRIMVLPLANLTGDAAQAYVADALTESITSDLSRIQDALIVPSATALTFKGKSLPQIAKELGVRYVLQGNVQRTGTTLRVNATLADAFKNTQLWTQNFEGDTTDLFALQDQITTRIGNSVSMQVVIAAARESETRKNSPKVADLIIRARALAQKPQSRENWQAVEDLYRQVLKSDPAHLDAMVGLATALAAHASNFPDLSELGKNQWGHSLADEQRFEESRTLALKVKARDPDNVGVFYPLSVFSDAHDDYPGGRSLNAQRLALQPRNAAAHNNFGNNLFDAGEGAEALRLFEQSNALSAVQHTDIYLGNAGRAHFMLGHDSQAIDLLTRVIEMGRARAGTWVYIAMAYARQGQTEKASQAKTALLKAFPRSKLSDFTPDKSQPDAYKQWHATQFVPAWRKAGLPE